ncbi:hypothetical protein RND81_13G065700 [Saponaria officinalis]|uniref:Leucine-rich repeat-containing N-terminal plant-type domain-containing protein n=1 Tax=Saponaria officinalis TaxID=3572 RepID=A0AAW1GY88_SAPOF
MKVLLLCWVFWIPFIHLITCISTRFASSSCLDDQRSLLLELRSSFEYSISESHKLSNWDNASDCCQWNGVQCNSSSGHVIGLDLCGESISRINDFRSLIGLRSLQSLNLANNSFNGVEFPTGFGKLTGLTYLNLSNAGFSGQIPIEISRLVNLVTLDLSSPYYLSGFPPLKLENPSLGTIIRNFTGLRGLYLNGVAISASGSVWCKALSTSVPNLQFLSLSSCNLSGGIDSSLKMLHSLSEIWLDQNSLADVVPDFIANYRNLTLLKLSSSQLNGTFPQKVLQLPTLRNLDLSYNSFLHGTLPEFAVGASLKRLVLSFTNFSGQLPESIGNLRQLQRIELSNCNFHGPIPSSVRKMNQLEYVDLSYNNFSGLVPSFSTAKNLTRLRLSNNMLTGTLSSTKWSNLSNLIDLDMSSNSLQGGIPMELFSLPSLMKLQLFQNKFSGTLRELPKMPSSSLSTLDLSNNYLKGSISNSLFGLKALGILKLSSNNFSGTLNLNVIQQLKNLSSLDISHNSLSIEANDIASTILIFPQLSTLGLASCNLRVLPEFLKNQSSLRNLDLSINSISGIIPGWIWGVGNGSLSSLNLSCNSFTRLEKPSPDTSNLNILDIHSNKIQGEVPSLTSPRLIYLDYSNNNFTSISPAIGNYISYTTYFSLSRNNISHEIPVTLCNATTLQVLDLSFNSLSGKIPQCVIEMTSTLKVLNLRQNNLTSSIFDEFPESCSLSTLNVGANSLQGQMPRSLDNCMQLEVLDVGRNRLSDTFPHWLRNMSNLRVLVLRHNDFYGSISCPKIISWPLLQIMDIAYNHFNGELKAQCFSNFTALMTKEPNSATSQLSVSILPFDGVFYQDMVAVNSKGEEITLQKILTVYKSIDISSNKFCGEIPKTIGNLITLIFLNLSNNALSGPIPSSIGNLMMLEALDLSHNDLNGTIPTQISYLNFLALLDLSYNKLTGTIPEGSQLQTFDSSAYIGNPGLCGPPLKVNCSSAPSKTVSVQTRELGSDRGLDWQFILIGAGLGTGVAFITAPLMFWRKGKKWHDKQVDKLVSAILSVCGKDQTSSDDGLDQDVGHQLFAFTSFDGDDKMNGLGDDTQFCLFCTKLDICRWKVIHNPRCTCHRLPAIISLSSTSFSE